MSLASSLDSPRPSQHLLLLQSSISQSCLPLIRHIITHNSAQKEPVKKLLFCVLHPPSCLVQDPAAANVQIYDYLDNIPGYSDPWMDPCSLILEAVKNVPETLPIEVIIDSLDTLLVDNGSQSQTYKFLRSLMSLISARSKPSRLVLHLCTPSEMLPLLVSTAFSPTIIQLIAHPPALLTHLATEYMTPPPPLSPEAKFWGVFIPISERGRDTEALIFGQGGEGSGGHSEMVVEVIARGGADNSGRRKAVERYLEGWDIDQGHSVDLSQMSSLISIWKRKVFVQEVAPDPTQNVSFNLHLTPSQQESRSKVPLPYAHEGVPSTQAMSAILYDPDSADDIDDDDPDEDLDI
ncbi:hypothetical protein BDP27DRAFT_1223148 [Rhodocollybia butyracea]|uniref:Elongator complex protein 5 n=1 Tax=Rhodocollybia butyracea TaxID=206335 RepID=A0A9P5PW52_9AGAR|nr:hypothetical protein BDP27DRAFT_1223148 [Rhodocollybia butyracea]